jgi:hypothetical protein
MGILGNAVSDRMKGDRPSAPRAVLAAVIAGVVAGGLTYKVLRA